MTVPSPDNLPYEGRLTVHRTSAYRGVLEAQRVPEHEHPELQFVTSQGIDAIEAAWQSESGRGGRTILRADEIAIIPSGQPHTFAWREAATVSCVYLDPHLLGEACDAEVVPALGALRPCFGLTDALSRELIIALAMEATAGFPSGRACVDTLEQALLFAVLRRSRPVRPPRPTPSLPAKRLAAVLDHIEAHFTEDLGLDELAAVACMSRFHFARAFKAATGEPPHRYLTGRRIREAKRLLATDLPLAVIAAALGFSDQSHFSARFRDWVGLSPGAFRKKQ
ncbi:MAG: AraC family transcriptional regulator [Burkholderiaceae bacterium]|nr:AraC family transcriptional regulator [Burkholderiaceae bacterium]